ncbi:MAG TPA: FMN-binding negative transcriptional regulator [Ilumatobacter sp.]
MYLPRHFAEDDVEIAVAMARSVGFGHLVVAGTDGLASTPMPFLIADDATLVRGHLARPNGIWRQAPCDALFVVPVADAYVSPNWYPSKAEHARVVPTWNYEVVHLHGRLVAHDDAAWTNQLVRDLTELHEATLPAPWAVDDAPADYLDQLMRGIVGVALEVTRVDAKRKLSQNKPTADIAGAAAALAGSPRTGASVVGGAMRRIADAAE